MFVVGLNHKTAPIHIRERFFLNPAQQDLLLSELKNNPSVTEAFVLSTCNRIEVYLNRLSPSIDQEYMVNLLAKVKRATFDFDVSPFIYSYQDEAAVEHLLKVASGIDSLVLGEKQILGQVKSAVERARQVGTFSKYFNILTNVAIRAGKKAQHETEISFGGSSISWAAIEQAERALGTYADKVALVIGAGKMGEIALGHLNNRGVKKIYLMNRTGEKAESVAAQYNGVPASFWDIKEILIEVDVCFCAVGAPHYILDQEKMQKIMDMRQGRPLVMIDISMPRNIDPAVKNIPSIHLSSIDDLDQVVNANMKKRQDALVQVEAIIRQKIMEFNEKIAKLKSLSESDFFEPVESLE